MLAETDSKNYHPFGMLMPERSYSSSAYRFGFNGQEKTDEISVSGNHNTAEHWEYDTRLCRRWNKDPVITSFQSGYACFSNNPIVMIDPKGDADFYNQQGRKVGTDGVNDGSIYILTTQSDIKKAQQSYFGKGIKGFFAILAGNGGKGTIKMSEFTGDVVPIPSEKVRSSIGDAVDRSNKPTADDTKGGFHEEAGTFGTNSSITETTMDAKPGPYTNPKLQAEATVDPFDAADPSKVGSITNLKGTFHIHPKGQIIESSSPGTGATSGTNSIYFFEQTPSEYDVKKANIGGNASGYNIVVGARNNTVYIYGSSGQNQIGKTYRATFPLDKFRSISNAKKTP